MSKQRRSGRALSNDWLNRMRQPPEPTAEERKVVRLEARKERVPCGCPECVGKGAA